MERPAGIRQSAGLVAGGIALAALGTMTPAYADGGAPGPVAPIPGVPATSGSSNAGAGVGAVASPFRYDPRVVGREVSAVMSTAASLAGVPYQWGGTDPAKGLDCSGYVQYVYAHAFGPGSADPDDAAIALPRTSLVQSGSGVPLPTSGPDAAPRAGDLVFFYDDPADPQHLAPAPDPEHGLEVHHVGIYAGQINGRGYVWNAPHTGASVRLEPIWTTDVFYRRLPQLAAGENSPRAADAPIPSAAQIAAQRAAAQKAAQETEQAAARRAARKAARQRRREVASATTLAMRATVALLVAFPSDGERDRSLLSRLDGQPLGAALTGDESQIPVPSGSVASLISR